MDLIERIRIELNSNRIFEFLIRISNPKTINKQK